MGSFGKINRSLRQAVTLGLVTAIAVTGLVAVKAHAASDCDNNAVIRCGISSTSSLITQFDNGNAHNSAASIQNIYSWFGISRDDIHDMNTTAQEGTVSASGNVFIGDQKVATDAVTAGRQDMRAACGGSTRREVMGTVFFTREPCVSFLSSPLDAFVVMKNGVFQFAIIKSCGNAVKATPKTMPPPSKPTPAPTPQPMPPAPKPAPVNNVCSGNTTNVNSGIASQGGNCSTNTTVVQTTTPPPAPASTAASGQCTSLEIVADQANPRMLTASVNFAVQNGAQLQSVSFDFGDSTLSPPSTQTSMSHTFQQGGTFNIKATLMFTGSQAMSPSACQASVTVNSSAPTCNALSVTQGDNRTVTVSNFQTTNSGATFTSADINWGDGTTTTGLTNLIGQNHQYAQDGTFNIMATAHFSVNGQPVTADGQNCEAQVTFTTPASPTPTTTTTPTVTTTSAPVTPITPPAQPTQTTTTPPSALVNTGSGNLVGIFMASATMGTLVYYYFLRRHLDGSM